MLYSDHNVSIEVTVSTVPISASLNLFPSSFLQFQFLLQSTKTALKLFLHSSEISKLFQSFFGVQDTNSIIPIVPHLSISQSTLRCQQGVLASQALPPKMPNCHTTTWLLTCSTTFRQHRRRQSSCLIRLPSSFHLLASSLQLLEPMMRLMAALIRLLLGPSSSSGHPGCQFQPSKTTVTDLVPSSG